MRQRLMRRPPAAGALIRCLSGRSSTGARGRSGTDCCRGVYPAADGGADRGSEEARHDNRAKCPRNKPMRGIPEEHFMRVGVSPLRPQAPCQVATQSRRQPLHYNQPGGGHPCDPRCRCTAVAPRRNARQSKT